MFTINPMDCEGCGLCIEACPRHAIEMVEGHASIDQARCDRCGDCLSICPNGAILQEAIVVSPPRAVVPAPLARSSALGAAGAVLAFVGTEVLPRVLPIVLDALERQAQRHTGKQAAPAAQRGTHGGLARRHGRGIGLGGACECPQCGYRVPHRAGVRCNTLTCPRCGSGLLRH